jgi:hypothetical protein
MIKIHFIVLLSWHNIIGLMDQGVCYFGSMGSFYNVSTIVESLLQYVANFTLSFNRF